MTLDAEREALILSLVDRLNETLLAANETEGDDRAGRQAQGVDLIEELSNYAIDLLEGREDLLEELIMQMVKQRLPDDAVADFDNLVSSLNEIVAMGAHRFRQTKAAQNPTAPVPPAQGEQCQQEEQITDQAPTVQKFPVVETASIEEDTVLEPEPETKAPRCRPSPQPAVDPVLQALSMAFPGQRVEQGYLFHGARLPYFLPEERLVVFIGEGGSRLGALQQFYFRQEGLKTVSLDAELAVDVRQAAQFIRRTKKL